MLSPKEGKKVGSLNGEIILPAICDYYVLLGLLQKVLLNCMHLVLEETEYSLVNSM